MGRGWKGFKVRIEYCKATGKPCYDKITAQTAINARFKEEHVRLRAYPCPTCQHNGENGVWHLTHINVEDNEPRARFSPHRRSSKESEGDD